MRHDEERCGGARDPPVEEAEGVADAYRVEETRHAVFRLLLLPKLTDQPLPRLTDTRPDFVLRHRIDLVLPADKDRPRILQLLLRCRLGVGELYLLLRLPRSHL